VEEGVKEDKGGGGEGGGRGGGGKGGGCGEGGGKRGGGGGGGGGGGQPRLRGPPKWQKLADLFRQTADECNEPCEDAVVFAYLNFLVLNGETEDVCKQGSKLKR